jgi:ABC-type molybdate transport system substrate-binding protein
MSTERITYRENVMSRRPSVLWLGMAALLGLISHGDGARAAELKVLASVAVASILDELSPVYSNGTGNKLSVSYGLSSDLKKRVLRR